MARMREAMCENSMRWMMRCSERGRAVRVWWPPSLGSVSAVGIVLLKVSCLSDVERVLLNVSSLSDVGRVLLNVSSFVYVGNVLLKVSSFSYVGRLLRKVMLDVFSFLVLSNDAILDLLHMFVFKPV